MRCFVETELNRLHQPCGQTGRQAKQFTSLCITAGHYTHLHNSFLVLIPQNGCAQSQLSVPIVASLRLAKKNDMKRHNVRLAAHVVSNTYILSCAATQTKEDRGKTHLHKWWKIFYFLGGCTVLLIHIRSELWEIESSALDLGKVFGRVLSADIKIKPQSGLNESIVEM